MRVALLSLTENVMDRVAGAMPRGLVPFGPHTVIDQQVQFALGLGCERVICLAHGVEAGIIDVQRRVERSGVQFHLIRSSRNLASLVRSADELLVLADGLLPLCEHASSMLSGGFGILELPVETGLAHGFERIDLNHAWAGGMIIPGGLVERLFELPEDADIPASLLRIALQARISERLLSEDVIAQRQWILIRSAEDAGPVEATWIRQQALSGDPFSPTSWVAGQVAAILGPSLIQRGGGSSVIAAGAIVLVIAAILVGSRIDAVTGLVMFVPALLILEVALAVRRIEGSSGRGKALPLLPIRRAFDAPLALLFACGAGAQADWQAQFFVPLVVLGLTLLLPMVHPARWTRLLEDRCLLALVAAILAGASVLLPVLRAYGLALLLAALFFAGLRKEITRT